MTIAHRASRDAGQKSSHGDLDVRRLFDWRSFLDLRHAGVCRTEPLLGLRVDGAGSGDHLRPDGRHQHGARRVHDPRRLRHLDDVEPVSAVPARPVQHLLFVAMAIAFVVAGALGMLVEWALIRHLYRRPLDTLLATWGLSLILQQTYRSVFGAREVGVELPQWM